MRTWRAPFENGHSPAVSAAGLLLCGSDQQTLVDFRVSPPRVWPLGPGRNGGWLTPTIAVFYRDVDDVRRQIQMRVRLDTPGAPPALEVVAGALFGGNTHDARDGSWAGWLSAGFRLVRDGVVLSAGHPCAGVAIAGPYTVTSWQTQASPERWAFKIFGPDATTISLPTEANAYRALEQRGAVLVSFGYNSPTQVLEGGVLRDVTVAPWGTEGQPLLAANQHGTPWVWSGTTHPTRGPLVAGRPLLVSQEGAACLVAPFAADGLDAVWWEDGDVWLVAGASSRGELNVAFFDFSDAAQAEVLGPAMPPFPKPILFAPFFQFSDRPGYGNTPDYPANATILVEPSLYERVARESPQLGIIVEPTAPGALDAAVRCGERVVAFYLGNEVPGWEIDPIAAQVKQQWKARTGHDIPVLWYTTVGMASRSDWSVPKHVDWFGVEYYFPAGSIYTSLREQLWRRTGFWMEKIGTARPWLPIIQAFDRSDPKNTADSMRDLARFQPEFLRMLTQLDTRVGALPPAFGLAPFAVNRPGGARDYPLIRAWHEAMFASIPKGPIQVPSPTPVPGGPVANPPKFSIVSPTFPPAGLHIPEGGMLTCRYAPEDGAGRIDRIHWLLDAREVANNFGDDFDHTYRGLLPGEHRIAAWAEGPGGRWETGQVRKLFVDRVEPPNPGTPDPGGPRPAEPGQPFVLVTVNKFYVAVNPEGQLVALSQDPETATAFERLDDAQGATIRAVGSQQYVRGPGDENLYADRSEAKSEEHYTITDEATGVISIRTADGRYWSAVNGGEQAVRANQRARGGWEQFTMEAPASKVSTRPGTPAGGPIDSEPASRMLRRLGKRFFTADGSTPFDYREASAFALLRRWLDGEDIDPFCLYWRRKKATALRIFLTLSGDFWVARGSNVGPSFGERYFGGLVALVRHLASRGIYARLVIVGGLEEFGVNPPDRGSHYTNACHARILEFIDRVVPLLRDEPNVLWEVMNEYNQIGAANAEASIFSLGHRIKTHTPQLMNLSNGNGAIADDPVFAFPPADFVDAHLDRRRAMSGFEWVKRSSESAVVDNDEMAFHSGEPINFGTPAPHRRDGDDNERSTAVAYAYGATARVKQYNTCFHYEDGLDAKIPNAETDACVDAWMRGLDAIPIDFGGGWCNGQHDCSPYDPRECFPGEGVDPERWNGPVRIFGRSGSRGYIGVSIREPRGWTPKLKPGRSVREISREESGDWCSVVRAE